MKQCMYIEVRPHMCGDSGCGNVNSHWWFVLCWLYKYYWCLETETSSIYWAQLSRFHLKMEKESSLRTIVWIMSGVVIVILIYHRHKPINNINLLGS
jgi:hypothetical protein